MFFFQYVGQHGLMVGREVLEDYEGCAGMGGEVLEEDNDGLEAAGAGADGNYRGAVALRFRLAGFAAGCSRVFFMGFLLVCGGLPSPCALFSVNNE